MSNAWDGRCPQSSDGKHDKVSEGWEGKPYKHNWCWICRKCLAQGTDYGLPLNRYVSEFEYQILRRGTVAEEYGDHAEHLKVAAEVRKRIAIEETKEPAVSDTIIDVDNSITFAKPTTYRLKAHNIRTFSDLQDMLETLDLRYIHYRGEDRAAKYPHLWEREE